MANTLRVAAAQTVSLSTVKDTLQSLESIARDAGQQGVGLLLFPEAYLGGYPRTCTFGAAIGSRDDHGRQQFQRYFEGAVDLGDTSEGAGEAWHQRHLPVHKGAEHRGDGTREELERIAKMTGVFLAVGVVEKAGSSLYCGMVFVSPKDGMLLEKRRKVMPTGTERLVWAQGKPSTLKAFTTTIQDVGVTIGTAICWENYMPLLRYSLYAQNVTIYLAPTADGRETWLPLLQTIASEGRAFVLSCNQVVRKSDLPSWVHGEAAGHRPPTHQRHSSKSSTASSTLGRRQSTWSKTDDGHEICWPTNESSSNQETNGDHEAETSQSQSAIYDEGKSAFARRRKSSIISTMEGHEICFTIPEKNSVSTKEGARRVSSDGAENDDDPFLSRGGSCVITPFGSIIEGPLWEKHGLLSADVDLDDCIRGKYDFDVAGHYSRSDAFKLTVAGLELNPP